jgi:hypothetical protein
MEIEVVPSPKPQVTQQVDEATVRAVVPAGQAPTAEEVQRETFAAMGWGEPPKPKVTAQAPTAPAAPAAPASPAQPAPAAIPQLTQDEVIQRTAAAVGSAVATAMTPIVQRQQAPPAPSVPSNTEAEQAVIAGMGEEDREDLEAVEFIELSKKGTRAKHLAYVGAVYAYQDKWLESHPGQDFDPDADEHAQFYAANVPPVSQRELDRAKDDMAFERRYNEKVKPEMDALKKEKADREELERRNAAWERGAAGVYLTANRAVVSLVKALDPDMAALLTGANGDPDMSNERCQAAAARDPILYEAINVAAKGLWQMTVALERTVLEGFEEKMDPKNGVHAAIMQAQREEEARILATPAEASAGGLRFVTVSEFNRTPSAQRAGLRCLTVDDMEAMILKNAIEQAKTAFENIDGIAKKKYLPAPSPAPARHTPAPAPSVQPQQIQRRTFSPSISSTSDVVTPDPGLRDRPKTYGEAAVQDHFGR